MNGYKTSFTAGDGMLTVVVDRDEQGGSPVARFSWDTDGALGELAAALGAMHALRERRQRCRGAVPAAGRRRAPRPRVLGAAVPLLDDLDQAIALLELGTVTP